ncbi:MAG: ATP-binding cassette domain-containing protein [Candidatus Marinimicrobia bacterium]|jgi:ABC-type oligopeptide transport system ATPase subunit|nr:ATP-binding cassette domain-containing protein [Candidatus Neomarinimicrobiota bacterium]|tara:strand:- start:901 stop:1773 length:873 start_codon:yes stop_codon:yes gene_type:complete
MNNKKPILKVRDLIVDFPIFGGILQKQIDSVHAVKKVSFDLNKGETLGIVGESGSGKSTLGNAIINVLRLTAPDVTISGDISLLLDDKEVEISRLTRTLSKPYRKHIQMIFQDPYSSLNPRMLVKDIIKEPLDINTNLTNVEKNEKVDWLLNKVGLSSEQSTRYPHEFSGGQRQRIGIARSLATEPEIIIADEPVSALDVSIQAQIINLMMDLQEEFNLSIIFIAHDLSVVKHISDRIGVMYNGELVEINNTDDIFDDPRDDYTKELLRAIPQPDPSGREERKRERLGIE